MAGLKHNDFAEAPIERRDDKAYRRLAKTLGRKKLAQRPLKGRPVVPTEGGVEDIVAKGLPRVSENVVPTQAEKSVGRGADTDRVFLAPTFRRPNPTR
jgi:hypothetical protein